MPGPNFASAPYGPFDKGLVEVANPSDDMTGALRQSQHWIYSGQDRMSIRPGLVPWMTLVDDQGSPAAVTMVNCVQPFADGAIAIAYSSVTQKCYLYRLNATLTGWFDHTGAAQATTVAAPIAVVWLGMAAAPEVMCAEGLGTLYIANTGASSSASLVWPTMTWVDGTWNGGGLVTLTALPASGTYVNNVQTVGTDTAYFLGIISYQQALWGWGYGAGASAATGYRPEMLRFSSPSFGFLMLTDSLTIGDRVRSLRERVVGAGVAGESLFVASAETLVRITGSGRDSWVKQTLDRSYGMVGPKAGVTVGDFFYYYSPRGPMRVEGLPQAYGLPPKTEPLFDVVYNTVGSVQNEAKAVAFFDPDHDQVGWVLDNGGGLRTMLTYDVRRSRYVGSAADFGVVPQCWGNVKAIAASTATPAVGPAGPPTTPTTTDITGTAAQSHWVPGDVNAQTELSVAPTATGAFSVVAVASAGVAASWLGALQPGTAYEWRARHLLNGTYSAYLGPATGTMFSTPAPSGGGGGGGSPPPPTALPAPKNLSASEGFTLNSQKQPQPVIRLSWTNSAAGATTVSFASLTSPNGPFGQVQSAAVGAGSMSIQYGVGVTPPRYWRVIHRETGFLDSVPSNTAAAY